MARKLKGHEKNLYDSLKSLVELHIKEVYNDNKNIKFICSNLPETEKYLKHIFKCFKEEYVCSKKVERNSFYLIEHRIKNYVRKKLGIVKDYKL